jgi:hypothetical protein
VAFVGIRDAIGFTQACHPGLHLALTGRYPTTLSGPAMVKDSMSLPAIAKWRGKVIVEQNA